MKFVRRFYSFAALFPTTLVLAILLVAFVLSNVGENRVRYLPPTQSQKDYGLFEGQGNLTFGCALWGPLTVQAYDESTTGVRPLADFYLSATTDEAVLVVARHDGIVVVSGLRCGISVDWTRIPREGN